jgi:hypothetical protein
MRQRIEMHHRVRVAAGCPADLADDHPAIQLGAHLAVHGTALGAGVLEELRQ